MTATAKAPLGAGMPPNYRPEIDGLRALAVLPVIGFHAGLPGFAGGFVGVDVFFVISGYLITSIILAAHLNGQFSFSLFYERRARRILPALFTVLFASLPAAWLLLTPRGFEEFASSLRATAVFTSNLHFQGESGYFATAAELQPLLHTWSLAIEEQFYLLFPLLLAVAWRYARACLGPLLLAGILASLVLAEALNGPRPEVAFFSLATRAWELLVGAWLAHRAALQPLRVDPRQAAPLSLLGLALIGGAIALFDHGSPHPGVLTLIPVAGTALVILYGGAPGATRRLLRLPALVGVGLISYSLYLWHQPLFAFARAWAVSDPGPALYLLLIALAFALATLTWRFVETPCRDRQRISARRLWQAAGAATAVVVAIGYIGVARDGLPERFPDHAWQPIAKAQINASSGFKLAGKRCANRPPTTACVLGADGATPTWALVGDSHAAALAAAVHERLRAAGAAGVQLTHSSCLYLPGLKNLGNADCAERARAIRHYLLASPVRNVIVSGRYVLQVERDRYDNGEGGVESGTRAGYAPAAGEMNTEPQRRQAVLAGYQWSIRELLAAGKNVYLVYPVPEVGWNLPDQLFKLRVLKHRQAEVTTSYDRYLARSAAVRRAFDALGDLPGLTRVRPDRLLCYAAAPRRCVTELDGQILYADDDHLNLEGGRRVVDALFAAAAMSTATRMTP